MDLHRRIEFDERALRELGTSVRKPASEYKGQNTGDITLRSLPMRELLIREPRNENLVIARGRRGLSLEIHDKTVQER